MLDLIDKKILKRYHIKEEVAKGASSIIYRAFDREHDRDVALKFLDAGYSDPDEFHQFVVQATRPFLDLNHENIAAYYGVERYLDRTFIVMQYVEGTSLRTLVEDHPEGMPLPQVLHLVEQIASALRYLHGQGLAHQDVRPANVLVTATGHAYLIDLQLVTAARQTPGRRLDMAGAAAYLAPERWENLTLPGDYRADIYALGISTFELLCGQRPYRGEKDDASGEKSMTRRMQLEHYNQPLPSVRTFRSVLPIEIDTVLAKATEKKPEKRYQDAVQFHYDLQNIVNVAIESAEDEGVLSLEETYTPVPQPKSKRRAPRRYWIGALLVLVAVGGIGLSILISIGEQRPTGVGLGTAETPTLEETVQAAAVTEAAPSATDTSEAETTETATLTPTEAASSTPTHTPTPSPTSTPAESATPTLTPSITPTPVIINTTISAANGTFVNLRTGPGEQYGRVDVLPADEAVEVDGKSADGLWVRLREPLPGVQYAWVASDLVRLSDEQRARLQEVTTNPSIRLGTSGDS
ncbi:MAG: protein kinase [Anaerolineae bacterium]|nr:protein kinase [Anaerolineae bacterium]